MDAELDYRTGSKRQDVGGVADGVNCGDKEGSGLAKDLDLCAHNDRCECSRGPGLGILGGAQGLLHTANGPGTVQQGNFGLTNWMPG